jgi:rubrerythrin
MDKVTIVDIAIENEKGSIFTYLEIARKTKDTSGKNMFITLASEEVRHLLSLLEVKDLFSKEVHKKTLEVPKSEIEKLLPDIKAREKKKHGKSELNELDALEIALEQEKKSMEFYETHYQSVDDDSLKALLKKLYETEKAHYELIMAQIDYIKGTGFWFDIPEFSME